MGSLPLLIVLGNTATGVARPLTGHVGTWPASQVLLGLALTQWFVVRHEAGRRSLLTRRTFNIAAVNVAWRPWLPLDSVIYQLDNYWHLPRPRHLFPASTQRRAMAANVAVLLAAHLTASAYFRTVASLSMCGLALLIGLTRQDRILLIQHTNMPPLVSVGKRRKSHSGEEPLAYTRPLRFPHGFAQWRLMNFNARERHHLHASVPGYRLSRLKDTQPPEVRWWARLRAAKRLSSERFVLGNRESTGCRR
ncbi:hypothetical protein [Accumulibacter sp.]|uniref:hypothetical protein n=1 Tax=Accumulibacter sp. TaxID=2053492 RepID=UPI00260C93CA|nr:hypothetical protein [Accumulibacter sp.]